MKSKIASLLFVIAFLVTSAFTSQPAAVPAAATAGITITDALGRTVTLEKTPTRIVLAGKALFMVADAIYAFPEAGKNIVALGSTVQGVGNFIPMIDPAFKDKTVLENNVGAEQIAAEKPDCVILKSSTKSTLGDPLETIGIPVVYVDFENPEQYDRDMKTLGQIFQNPDRAEKVMAYFNGKADSVAKTLSGLKDEQKPKTLILYYSDKDGTVSFNVPPMGWMQTILVKNGGGIPVWEDANPAKGWTKVSLEQVAAWNPDVIFVVAYATPVVDVIDKLESRHPMAKPEGCQRKQTRTASPPMCTVGTSRIPAGLSACNGWPPSCTLICSKTGTSPRLPKNSTKRSTPWMMLHSKRTSFHCWWKR